METPWLMGKAVCRSQYCDLFKQLWTTSGHNLALWMTLTTKDHPIVWAKLVQNSFVKNRLTKILSAPKESIWYCVLCHREKLSNLHCELWQLVALNHVFSECIWRQHKFTVTVKLLFLKTSPSIIKIDLLPYLGNFIHNESIFTARKRSCGKVMFLQLSVILFTGE